VARTFGGRLSRLVLAAALVVLGVPATGVVGAGAASDCGERVIADWRDGRIDGVYELRCYEEAVEALPEDVRAYSSAADDIRRALQEELHAGTARERTSSFRGGDALSTARAGSSESCRSGSSPSRRQRQRPWRPSRAA
jgi:hypothetical protein